MNPSELHSLEDGKKMQYAEKQSTSHWEIELTLDSLAFLTKKIRLLISFWTTKFCSSHLKFCCKKKVKGNISIPYTEEFPNL